MEVEMPWTDQKPEATDILISFSIVTAKGKVAHIEVDRIINTNENETTWDHIYRATEGNLFGSGELVRHKDLDHVLRWISHLCDRN
jgi:hypothetical protein